MADKQSYGILTYNSINIGDEIQSVAAMRFLPQVDKYIYRELVNRFVPKNKEQTKLIMNAWWMFKPENFIPSKWITPLLISMHIRPEIREKLLTPAVIKYLMQNGPVGCRDMSTYEWLKSKEIPAYFSGCLTLTLQRNYNIPRKDYILCVDADKKVVEKIKTLTDRPVYEMSRWISPYYTSKQRMDVAKLTLRAYHDAALVVSHALHVLLPSLAMETPVLRVDVNKKLKIEDTSRFIGYESFFNSVNIENGLEELEKYDFNNPLQNPSNHLEMRNSLIQKCSEFTGFNNIESLIKADIDPFIELLKLSKKNQKQIERICYWSSRKNLKNVVKNKKRKLNQYDLLQDSIVEPVTPIKIYFKYFKYKFLSKYALKKLKREHYKKKLKKIESYIEIYLYNKEIYGV